MCKYRVLFNFRKVPFETIRQSPYELSFKNAEGFAWGAIRDKLQSEGIDLTGFAYDITVLADNNTVIWKREVIDIPSCIETIQ